jgi:osmotically-inducible protein OsmY
MKRYHQSDPLADGNYKHANLNRERREPEHDRYPAKDDRRHRDEAKEKNEEQQFKPRESSFYGNISQREGNEFEREAGYRERFRKIGEGYQQKDQGKAWPNYPKDHRGKGPKNYQRPDMRIQDEVHHLLTDHPALDASDIEVKIENGDVILTGSVETRQAKRLAEDICENVKGVKNVENRLRVQHSIGNGSSIGNP